MDERVNYEGGEWVVDAGEIMDGAVETELEAAPEAAGPEEGESFELKHLGEAFSVDRERVTELAQKGLDYDRIREKLDAARGELGELRRWLGEVSGGRDAGEFKTELSARALAEREGIGLDEAMGRVRDEAERREAERAAAQTGAAEGGRIPGERKSREAREFFDAHPDAALRLLGGEALPREVWRRVRAGESLTAAYEAESARREAETAAGRIRALEAELERTRLEKTNAGRSTGSAAGDGGDAGPDAAAMGWESV